MWYEDGSPGKTRPFPLTEMQRSILRKQLDGLLITISLAACLTPAYAGAPEQVSIQTLFAQSPSYQSHQVTLQGTTRDLQVIPPMPALGKKCPMLYGRATFTLDDGTGSLPVEVQGSCLRPQAVDALPQNGDMVQITAMIYLLNSDLPVRLLAQATEIRILDPK
jgi:hypothetical protein